MSDILISCQNLSFYRGEAKILDSISFDVPRGEIVGLLGKNGAGKSTTINLLMGFLEPQAGKLEVLGYPSHAIPPKARRAIGLLHEGFTQYDFMTISEIERFYRGFYPAWDREIYFELVSRMKAPADRRIKNLSCGQRSQVTLGLLLAQRPEVLILDDFSLGLDVGYRKLFLEYLKDYTGAFNTTVMLTSHVVSELEKFLDRVLLLKTGRIIADKTKERFMKDYRCYAAELATAPESLVIPAHPVINTETGRTRREYFTEASPAEFAAALGSDSFEEVPMSFEDTFVGLTGRY